MGNKETTVKGTAKRSVLKLTPGARALGRGVKIQLAEAPETEAAADLAGDAFHAFWSFTDVEIKDGDRIPTGRTINERLMRWFTGMDGYQKTRQSAAGCIPAAAGAAVGAYHFLTDDDSIQKALAEQERAQEQEQERDQCQRAADAMRELGETEQAAEYEAQAAEHAAQAAEHAAAAQAAIDGLEESELHTALAADALKKAAEQADEIRETMAGWGLTGGDPEFRDANAAMRFMDLLSEEIARVAKIAGRVRGISSQARPIQKDIGVIPTNMQLSRDPRRIIPRERLRLSDAAPPEMRLQAQAEFLQNGLLSVEQSGEGEEKGPFVAAVDRSGSMSGLDFSIAKGVALGLCQTARNESREYRAGTFAGKGAPIVEISSDDDFETLMKWAGQVAAGGTDFNGAMTWAMDRLEAMGETSGADLLFITDGRAKISDSVLERWLAFAEETGARFVYVPTSAGKAYDKRIAKIADETIVMGELNETSAAELAQDVGSWMKQ